MADRPEGAASPVRGLHIAVPRSERWDSVMMNTTEHAIWKDHPRSQEKLLLKN